MFLRSLTEWPARNRFLGNNSQLMLLGAIVPKLLKGDIESPFNLAVSAHTNRLDKLGDYHLPGCKRAIIIQIGPVQNPVVLMLYVVGGFDTDIKFLFCDLECSFRFLHSGSSFFHKAVEKDGVQLAFATNDLYGLGTEIF